MSDSKVTFIDFWAPWCGPCKMMDPIIHELEAEFAGKIIIEKVNVDEDPAKSSRYGVMSIPTYVIEKDGKEVGRKVGMTSKDELVKLLNV